MKSLLNFDKTRAALILFSAAFILLLANIFIADSGETGNTEQRKNFTYAEVDSFFIISLKNFGLPDNCILKKQASKIPYTYRIKIPTDLSIPVILSEINNVFSEVDVTINVIEKSFNGLTDLEIKSEETIILKAKIDYDAELKRKTRKIAFIIDNFKLLSSEDSSLLDISEPFSLLIKPSSQAVDLIKFIEVKNKTYSLLLDDNIIELKYKLDEDYSFSRMEGPLVSILNDFRDATLIFIDDKSGIYNSDSYSLIKGEFSKRKIDLIELNRLSLLNERDDDQLVNLFDEFMKNLPDNNRAVILLTQQGFKILYSEIKKYKKLGYIVVPPTEVI
ncbi:MAG: hypothetical protein PVF17_01865 [Ignavibacteria bacterium]|jgi:hypothetical protein